MLNWTAESELVKQAQEQANQIINAANQSSDELKASSIQYAGDVLKYVENNLEKHWKACVKIVKV